ncbi:MAG TPA: hypothetical protein VLM05_18580 [Mycobacteriales bacterium]|nr:hypothetical protein [Mycobacteriales bacterium]
MRAATAMSDRPGSTTGTGATTGTGVPRRRVRPGLAQLDPAEAARWRSRLDRTERPCGCKSGAAAMLAAFVAWPVWAVVHGVTPTPAGIAGPVLAYPVVVIGGALGGKVAGILTGRLRHRIALARLARRVAAARGTVGG